MLVGLQSMAAAIWKALCSSLGAHQNLQTLSLAGSAIWDATLQVSLRVHRVCQRTSILSNCTSDCKGCCLKYAAAFPA